MVEALSQHTFNSAKLAAFARLEGRMTQALQFDEEIERCYRIGLEHENALQEAEEAGREEGRKLYEAKRDQNLSEYLRLL